MGSRSQVLHTEVWWHLPFKAANFCNIFHLSVGSLRRLARWSLQRRWKIPNSLMYLGKFAYLWNIWLLVEKYREISMETGKGKTINRWKYRWRKKSKKVSLHIGNSISFYKRWKWGFPQWSSISNTCWNIISAQWPENVWFLHTWNDEGRDFSFIIDYTQALVNLEKASIQMKSEMTSLNTIGKTEFILFDICSQRFFYKYYHYLL